MNLLDLFVFVWAIGKALAGKGEQPQQPDRKPRPRAPDRSRRPGLTVVPATTAPAWPQVVPSGLPPFPGSGWVPDNPPPPAVVARANALLPALWASGEGTFKVEQTAGRWIVYRASRTANNTKGVVAFRESAHSAFLTPPSSAPVVSPAGPVQTASARPASSSAQPASSSAMVPASSSSLSLPTLRRGSRGPDVQTAQRALGITADGAFGPGTENAVRQYQRSRGLTPDGVIGPQTWGALLGKAA